MGTVYLAEDTVLGRQVALKVVATAAARAGGRRAHARRRRAIIARLEHPGIVPVHDAGALPDGRVFYAMKRVDGKRLDELAGDAAAARAAARSSSASARPSPSRTRTASCTAT